MTGQNTRIALDGKKLLKVSLDPLDKDKVVDKLDAIREIYKSVTTHNIVVGFSKPNSFQKKVIDAKK